MLRTFTLGLAALSIGCAAETYVTDETEACGWMVTQLVSFDEDAGDCEWSIRTLDVNTSRLRSIYGAPHDPTMLCDLRLYERIDALHPMESVEVWSPGPVDASASWRAVELGACH